MTTRSRLVTSAPLILLASLAMLATQPAQSQPTSDDRAREQYEELERIYSEGSRSASNEEGEDIRARDAWFHYQRAYPYAQIPAGARSRALRATDDITKRIARSRAINGTKASLLAATSWQSIGPTNQGGRIRAVAIHPRNSGTFLVGAAAGGVWRTTDGGQTWQPTFDSQSAIAVGSLAYDPTNPDIVYAGTGENFPSSPTLLVNTPSYLGDGVFKSTDGGLTWKHVGLSAAGAVSKIYVHHQNPLIVYAAVARENGGFYRSSDGGATWQQTVAGNLYDMTINPGNSDEVYVAHPSAIRRSTDGGVTFTSINNGLTRTAGVRMSVAIAPSDPSRLYVLAARDGGANGREVAEVYISTDRGDNWTLNRAFGESFFNDQGVYDNFIAVHPTDPNIVLAGGIDVFRTSDGGATWTNVTRVYSGGDVHPDQHIAQFDPTYPDVVVLGNDGGVYTSLDAGADWTHQSKGLAVTQFYRMEVDQTRPFRVYGGTQDNGTSGSFGAGGYTNDWTRVLGGDGFFVAVDQGDPNWFYAEIYYGTLYRISATNPAQRVRVDNGIPTSGADADEGNWATPIAMSPADRVSLYSGRASLWRTTDRGGSWRKIPVGLSSKIGAIGLSPTDARKIVLGSLSGSVRYSTDYGATWATGTGMPGGVVTSLRFDPSNESRVYATISGFGSSHVYRSDDNGASWTNISANLPIVPVNAIEIDPQNARHLFIATDVGAFFSPNAGGFWIPFNEGLPLAPISDLRIHVSSRSLIAATHGRSMFRVSIDDLVIEPTLVTPVGGERISTPGPLTVQWFGLSSPTDVFVQYADGEPFVRVATGVAADSITIELPLRLSTTARVRVVETSTSRELTSGYLSLTTPANTTALGRRAFHAEAIELRGTTLWATSRGSDTIYRLRLPLLTGGSPIVRSGWTGAIRDLAYDAERDEFLVLVTAPDNTSPRIHRIDTNARSLGELALPAGLTTAVGIEMRATDLVVTTPAPSAELWLLDPATGAERAHYSIDNAVGRVRRGLVWNGRAFVQGVMLDSGDAVFDSELQQMSAGTPPRVVDRMPVILSSMGDLDFFGLAYDPGSGSGAYYFLTDTSGMFFRLPADFLSSVGSESFQRAPSSISAAAIRPNPATETATLALVVDRARELAISIVDATGVAVVRPRTITLESGRHELPLEIKGLSGGLYYVVVDAEGDRLIRPLSIVR